MRLRPTAVVSLLAAPLFALGCRHAPPAKNFARELPPGRMALELVSDPSAIPFEAGLRDKDSLLAAIDESLSYLQEPSAARCFPYQDPVSGYSIPRERAIRSLKRFKTVWQEAKTGEDLKRRILEEFAVFRSIGWDGAGGVLFTAYYTGTFEGSRTPDETYRYPLYRRPPDLVSTPEGKILGRRTGPAEVVPYYDRREIEAGALAGKGLEICWLRDPFEGYVAQVQGHADIRLPNASILKLGNAGTNGHEYRSIRNLLVASGKLAPEKASLAGLREYFRLHPSEFRAVAAENPRYPFFVERTGAPVGSLNVPVTTRRSIATDKAVFPRGCLAFCDTRIPAPGDPIRTATGDFRQFVLDQDTGGALRAAGRADIYIGRGPLAERIAGRTESEGRLYYLFLKEGKGEEGPVTGMR